MRKHYLRCTIGRWIHRLLLPPLLLLILLLCLSCRVLAGFKSSKELLSKADAVYLSQYSTVGRVGLHIRFSSCGTTPCSRLALDSKARKIIPCCGSIQMERCCCILLLPLLLVILDLLAWRVGPAPAACARETRAACARGTREPSEVPWELGSLGYGQHKLTTGF